MRVRKLQEGFTLIELMLVVVIFSILASTLVPGVSGLLSQQDVKSSSEKVRSIFQFARSQSAVENVAHQVIITLAQGDSGGTLRVLRGNSTSCVFNNSSPLVRKMELVSIVGANVTAVDGAEAGRFDLPTRTRITSLEPNEIVEDGICFRPDGSVRDAETNLPVIAAPGSGYGAGDVVLVLQDHIVANQGGSAPTGTPLRILVPYNGIARVTF